MKFLITLALITSSTLTSCSYNSSSKKNFLDSGTILVSKSVKDFVNVASLEKNSNQEMNQLIGFFPPSEEFAPAFNEFWLEIDTENEVLIVRSGNEIVSKLPTYGAKFSEKGDFYLSAKDSMPKWIAPDSYFKSRGLGVPQNKSRIGAYGKIALIAKNNTNNENLVIHSSPFWTSEVGGIKVQEAKLKDIISKLPVGSLVVVK